MKSFAITVISALLIGSLEAFAPIAPSSGRAATTSLEAARENNGFDLKKVAASAFAAAFLAANVVAMDPALALDSSVFDFGSSEVISARSGGRSGGRVSSGGARSSMGRSSSYSRSSTTIVRPTTVITSPSYVAPPVYIAPSIGYGYNPLGGLGMGYALGSMNNIGNDMRDYRQESEIQQSKAQLEQARIKEAELEARLRQLEAAQQPR
jgi:hypothetical protein